MITFSNTGVSTMARGDIMEWKRLNWTTRKLFALAALVIAFLLVFFLWNGKNGVKTETITIQPQKYEEKIIAVGQLRLEKETSLISEVSAEIQTVGAAAGDIVPAGTLIIALNHTDEDFQLEQKKAGYENADAQYQHLLNFDYVTAKGDLNSLTSKKDQAKKAYDAAEELYRQGAMSQVDNLEYKADYEAALADWNAARLKVESLGAGGALRSAAAAQLQSAKASYESALNDQQKYQITVPWDSVILKTYVNEHDYVRQGDRLADIGEAGSSYVIAELDEKYFPYLSKGMKALISVGDPGSADGADGYLNIISPKINNDTGTFEVRIGLPDQFQYMASDLTVNVEILIKEKENAVVIPDRYLIGQEASVYLYKNGKAVKTAIRYERGPSSNLLVSGGLRKGDIIIRPDSSVKDGMAVRIGKGGGAS